MSEFEEKDYVFIEDEMKKYFDRAMDFIEIIPVNENRKSELIKFAQLLNRRES